MTGKKTLKDIQSHRNGNDTVVDSQGFTVQQECNDLKKDSQGLTVPQEW